MTDELGVGHVLEVETLVFLNGDHAPYRFMVVVQAPTGASGLVGIVQRSSTVLEGLGCPSNKDSMACFTKEGRWVFKYHRVIRKDLLVPAIVRHCGELPEPERTNLLTRWEQY